MVKLTIAALAALLSFSTPSSGQEFPSRPITIIVGLAAGGVSDVVTRLYAETVSKMTGYKFVVENRPTGSGAVAAAALQTAQPDGYTLYVLAAAQHATIPAMDASAPYDPVKGNQPITLLFSIPTLVIVPSDSPANSLTDLTALAKTKSGGLNVGSPGLGTPSHLSGAKLMALTKTPSQFVHYRGGAPLLTDLLPGRIDAAVISPMTAKPHLLDKKIKALSSDGAERWASFADVPVLRELGLEDATIATWFGLVAPPGTPEPIVSKLNAAFVAASKDPELRKRLNDNGLGIVTSTPKEMSVLIAKATTDIADLVGSLGLRK